MFTNSLREMKEYNKSLGKVIVQYIIYNCYTFKMYIS